MDTAALLLTIVGALNWLLVGVASFDLVGTLFGAGSVLSRVVYGLVGVAGLWTIFYLVMFNPLRHID